MLVCLCYHMLRVHLHVRVYMRLQSEHLIQPVYSMPSGPLQEHSMVYNGIVVTGDFFAFQILHQIFI